MNKTQLIDAIAKDADVSKAVAQKVLDSVIENISSALEGKDTVSLIGFGSFGVSERAARSGRNPRTGDTIQIAASTIPVFKAGKGLKDRVNK